MTRSCWFSILFLIAVCFVLADSARAQTVATISGNVTDASNATVSGAQVMARNQDTSLSRSVLTDQEGHYVIALLPIGHYTIRVSASGFKTAENKDVTLEVQQSLVLDIRLQLASVQSEVNVVAAAPEIQVQRTDGSISQTIHTEQVSELPLNGRDFVQLAWLGTGTVKQQRPGNFLNQGGSSEVSFRASVALSSQGMRENANDWLYDGVDDNELTAGGVGFLPSIDAINEFKVMTYNFSAQYGSRAGTTVLVSSKSGTNSMHGSVFEFLRNDVLDARNAFDGAKKGKYNQNEYGAALGGPLIKDKTFYFMDFQVNTIRQGLTSINTVPTLLQRQGNFTELFGGVAQANIFDPNSTVVDPVTGKLTRTAFVNKTIPAGRIDPIAQQLINLLPLPNIAGAAVNNYRTNPVKSLDDAQWDVRVDHELTGKDHIFGRFSWDNANQFLPDGLPGFGSPGAFNSNQSFIAHARHIALSESHIFSSSLVNQFTAGYNRDFNYISSFGTGSNESQKVGIPGANLGSPETSGLTQISITGFAGLGDRQFSPFQGGTNVYHYFDTLNWVHGQHTLAFGFEFRAMQENTLGDNAFAGTFTFNRLFTAAFTAAGVLDPTSASGNAVASFLLGLPASGGRNDEVGGAIRGRRWKEYREFVADTWAVNQHLSLDLGLAYAYTTPISEAANRFSNLDFVTGQIFVAGQGASGTVGVKPDRSNVEPRFGFAWSPWSTKNTVIRGGYGIYHDVGATGGTTGLYQNPPYAAAYAFTSNSIAAVRTLATGFPPNSQPQNPATYAGVWHVIDTNFQQGLVQQWNLNVQHSFPSSLLLTVAYTGTHGTRLSRKNINLNSAPPNTVGNDPAALRKYPQFNQIQDTISDGWLTYESLQIKAERRAAKGLYLLAGYTYSKAQSNGLRQEITGDPGINYFPFIPAGNSDRGLASTDLRNNFTFSYLYDLPFGRGQRFLSNLHGVGQAILGDWEFNGITVAHSGFGLGFSMGTSASGTSFGNRPNVVSGCDPYASSLSSKAWFNPACFSAPAAGVLGNSPRTMLYGPGQVNFDMAFSKNFVVTEKLRAQFRSEFFNIFNHTQFATPATAFGLGTFGTITSTVNPSRQIQFALKFLF
jgi:hypothetical protein